jgi:hypothetical protein
MKNAFAKLILLCLSVIFGMSEPYAADAVSAKLEAYEDVINKKVNVCYDIYSYDTSTVPEVKVGAIKYYRAPAKNAGKFKADNPGRHNLALYYSLPNHPFKFFVLGNYADGVVYFPGISVAVPVLQKDKALLLGVTQLTGGVSPLDIKAILSLSSKYELKPADQLKCKGADTCAEIDINVTKLQEKKILPDIFKTMKIIIFFDSEPEVKSIYMVVNEKPFSRTDFSRKDAGEKEIKEKVYDVDLSSYETVPMPLAEAMAKAYAAEGNKPKNAKP